MMSRRDPPLQLVFRSTIPLAAGQYSLYVKFIIGWQIIAATIILPMRKRLELINRHTCDDHFASLVLESVAVWLICVAKTVNGPMLGGAFFEDRRGSTHMTRDPSARMSACGRESLMLAALPTFLCSIWSAHDGCSSSLTNDVRWCHLSISA